MNGQYQCPRYGEVPSGLAQPVDVTFLQLHEPPTYAEAVAAATWLLAEGNLPENEQRRMNEFLGAHEPA